MQSIKPRRSKTSLRQIPLTVIAFTFLLSAQSVSQNAQQWRDIRNNAEKSVVRVQVGHQSNQEGEEPRNIEHGSGFVVSEAGHIVTAKHLFKNTPAPGWRWHILVSRPAINPNELFEILERPLLGPGEAGKDDYAILKLSARNKWPFLCLGQRDKVNDFDSVLALGYGAYRKPEVLTPSVSLVNGRLDTLWKLDKRLNKGDSGGPVLDAQGRVFGTVHAAEHTTTLIVPIDPITREINEHLSKSCVLDSLSNPHALCVNTKLEALRNRTSKTLQGEVTCAAGGLNGRGEEKEQTVGFSTPQDQRVVKAVIVQVSEKNGASSHEEPQYVLDADGAATTVKIRLKCRSENYFGSAAAWIKVRVTMEVERKLSNNEHNATEQSCIK